MRLGPGNALSLVPANRWAVQVQVDNPEYAAAVSEKLLKVQDMNKIIEYKDIRAIFKKLSGHPFTTIGLADREKFHTGMLSFAINRLKGAEQVGLLKALWGEDRIDFEAHSSDYSSEVERSSVDLLVKQGGKIVLFAEMKFKTTLHSEQLVKYQKALGTAKGSLFALFTDFELDVPHGYEQIAFPGVVARYLGDKIGFIENPDEATLIRLWVDYLRYVDRLTRWYESIGEAAVPDRYEFKAELDALRLKGIFEHYRFSHLRDAVLKSYPKASEIYEINQFNSNGNSAIEFSLDTMPATEKSGFKYGIQWQAGSVKLFVSYKDAKPADTSERAKLLETLWRNVAGAGFDSEPKLNKDGRFQSITLEKWDIFEELAEDRVNWLVGKLQTLSNSIY